MSRLESLANILTKYCAAGVGGNVCVNITKYDAEMISKEIKDIQTENEQLKRKVEQVANIKVNSLYDKANKMLDMQKILEERKEYKQILDILKPYIIVEDLNGCYWLRIGGNGYDKYFVYEITKEQYDILKEWLENE